MGTTFVCVGGGGRGGGWLQPFQGYFTYADRSSKMGEIRRTREKNKQTKKKKKKKKKKTWPSVSRTLLSNMWSQPLLSHMWPQRGLNHRADKPNGLEATLLSTRLQGAQGDQGNNVIYFRGTEAHKSKNEGNMGTIVILGNREQKINKNLIFGKQGKRLNYFRRTREQVPRPLAPPSHHPHPGRASLFHYPLHLSMF